MREILFLGAALVNLSGARAGCGDFGALPGAGDPPPRSTLTRAQLLEMGAAGRFQSWQDRYVYVRAPRVDSRFRFGEIITLRIVSVDSMARSFFVEVPGHLRPIPLGLTDLADGPARPPRELEARTFGDAFLITPPPGLADRRRLPPPFHIVERELRRTLLNKPGPKLSLAEIEIGQNAAMAVWSHQNPELAGRFVDYLEGSANEIDRELGRRWRERFLQNQKIMDEMSP